MDWWRVTWGAGGQIPSATRLGVPFSSATRWTREQVLFELNLLNEERERLLGDDFFLFLHAFVFLHCRDDRLTKNLRP